MIKRHTLLNLIGKTSKSLLLIGPRQVGKSTLVGSFSPELTINLANERELFQFSTNPGELMDRLERHRPKSVFIDEVQRLPSVLNNVQVILDQNKAIRFFLTGSSARKLRRGQANLLPGRVIAVEIGPLTAADFDYRMDEKKALAIGTLPGIYTETNSFDQEQLLTSYAATYLREEIQAEALARNLEGFSRLLLVSAAHAINFIDYTKFANEAGINRMTAMRYLEVMEDTLLIHRVYPFAKSGKTRLIQHPRLFFFDNGVLNALLGGFAVTTDRMGKLFENLMFSQIFFGAKHAGLPVEISTFRTEHGSEVDFVVRLAGTIWAVEAKASKNVGPDDLRGLRSFREFFGKSCRCAVAYLGSVEKSIDGVVVLPWQSLLREMGL
ncbi:MAG: ATP-binding protein [Oligoflexales bacterium]